MRIFISLIATNICYLSSDYDEFIQLDCKLKTFVINYLNLTWKSQVFSYFLAGKFHARNVMKGNYNSYESVFV